MKPKKSSKRWWLLAVTFYQPRHNGGYRWENWCHEGATAVEAFQARLDEIAVGPSDDPSWLPTGSNAVLLNAWPITEAQADRLG